MYASAMSPSAAQSERYVDPTVDDGVRTYGMFEHLVGLLSAMDAGMGVLGLVGAIVLWRIKANEAHFLDDHGREAVNFQISLLAYVFGGTVAAVLFSIVTLGIGSVVFALTPIGVVALIVLRMVGCIRGAMAAHRGEYYRYPMCIRFIKGPADA